MNLIQPEAGWLAMPDARRVRTVAIVTAFGLALYGFSAGFWRAPLMGLYVAVKMPLLVACTLACNGLLNGLIGLLLGTGLGFRQSLLALLSAFAVAALILGSLSPVLLLMAVHAPGPEMPGAQTAHAAYLVAHTALIAFAGLTANLHLHRLLTGASPDRMAANLTLIAWLGGNAFLGAQFSWLLRPFFGSPGLTVQFLRPDWRGGTFYEAVWNALDEITNGHPLPALLAAAITLVLLIARSLCSTPTPQP